MNLHQTNHNLYFIPMFWLDLDRQGSDLSCAHA